MQAEDDPMPLKPTRAGFVRGLPETMPIDEVIERAREIGLPLNPSDVHSARYYMRQEALAKLSSRPSSVPQLVQASPIARPKPEVVVRAKPEEAKPEPAPTNILGLRSATNGKARASGSGNGPKGRRTQAQARPAAPPAKQQRLLQPPSLPPVKFSKGLEEQLRQIVMRIGTERARQIIKQIEDIEV